MMNKFKMSRSAFESCIRAKMGDPHDFDNIDVIEDENCEKCELCGWLIAELNDVKFHNKKKRGSKIWLATERETGYTLILRKCVEPVEPKEKK